MKKAGILLLIFLLLSLFLNVVVKAQDPLPPELESGVEKIQNVSEKLSDEDARKEYLKQEWTKILESKWWGKMILGIGVVFGALSPVFKLLIGIEYSLSWLFFLSLGAWIAIVVIIYEPAKNLIQTSGWVSFGIAAVVATLGAQLGTIQMALNLFLPLFKNLWSTLTTILVVIILIYAYSSVMKYFGEKMKEDIKRENEQRREQKAKTVEQIHDIEIKAHGG